MENYNQNLSIKAVTIRLNDGNLDDETLSTKWQNEIFPFTNNFYLSRHHKLESVMNDRRVRVRGNSLEKGIFDIPTNESCSLQDKEKVGFFI